MTASNAAVNIGVHVSSNQCFHFLGIYIEDRIAGSYDSSIFNFLRNFHAGVFFCLFVYLFVLTVVSPIYIPTNSALEFSILHILANTYSLSF